jgi:hypothetical protein
MASSWSCVTRTKVMPAARWISRSSSCMSSRSACPKRPRARPEAAPSARRSARAPAPHVAADRPRPGAGNATEVAEAHAVSSSTREPPFRASGNRVLSSP